MKGIYIYMDIKAISSPSVSIQANQQTLPQKRKAINSTDSDKNNDVVKNKKSYNSLKKALPYVAGAIVLAGAGGYILKNRGKNIVEKTLTAKASAELKEELKEISEEITKEFS